MSQKYSLMPLAAMVLAGASAIGADTFPEGNGKQLVENACAGCHELERVSAAGYTEEEWRNNINQMVNVGAPLAKDQMETVVQYLAKSFPAKPKPAPTVGSGSASGATGCPAASPGATAANSATRSTSRSPATDPRP